MAFLPSLRSLSILLLAASSAYALYIWWKQRDRRKGLPLPPGPPGWPIIGNALDIPLESMGPVYAGWAKNFCSEVVSANALGTSMVVIDSYDAAIELLEKRAVKYSCRPVSVMACELMGWDCIFVLNPYSELWRERRRLFVKYFRPPGHSGATSESPVHVPQVYEFVHNLLLDLNETPEEVYGLVRHMIGSLTISLTYGVPVQRRRDELVEFVDSVARLLGESITPGNAIVDVIPALNYIPASIPIPWTNGRRIPVPGMGWKRYAKSLQWMAVRFKMEGYERAVKGFGTEGVRPSFTSDALISLEARDLTEEARLKEVDAIQAVSATVFATAADTTTNTMLTNIFALATHPEVRKRIQHELDTLLVEHGESGKRSLRLPTFEDQDKLPLLMAAVMESQRWAPVTPIGVPHRTTEDDVYQEYFIPKGSVIIANIWSMLNDKKEYGEDALKFNPDRFIRSKVSDNGGGIEINPEVRHPATIAFGFGRRVCPGSHIAQSTLWLTSACLLALYDFEAPESEGVQYVGADGKVDPGFDPGFLCQPKKFRCTFTVRSEEARVLLGELGMNM